MVVMISVFCFLSVFNKFTFTNVEEYYLAMLEVDAYRALLTEMTS